MHTRTPLSIKIDQTKPSCTNEDSHKCFSQLCFYFNNFVGLKRNVNVFLKGSDTCKIKIKIKTKKCRKKGQNFDFFV